MMFKFTQLLFLAECDIVYISKFLKLWNHGIHERRTSSGGINFRNHSHGFRVRRHLHQRLLDAECRESSRWLLVPAFLHKA